ncbi:hypothetical protein LUV23_09970 [Streptomyces malaysiensis subsp. malaysiensis]|nr:hypothetical protein [Streptomyces sp. HNM0561]UHH16638.1 hypothetical protein LUV23_09970 [Streptomyces sp. HNM0561]
MRWVVGEGGAGEGGEGGVGADFEVGGDAVVVEVVEGVGVADGCGDVVGPVGGVGVGGCCGEHADEGCVWGVVGEGVEGGGEGGEDGLHEGGVEGVADVEPVGFDVELGGDVVEGGVVAGEDGGVGAVDGAMEMVSLWLSRWGWRVWGSVATASMAPPGGRFCMRVPRVVTRWTASGRVRVPVMWAAVISPTECPQTMSGCRPQDSQSR